MLFNSIYFAIFFIIFFTIYWFLRRFKPLYQNLFILVGSYFFYGIWDYRFLFMLAGVSIVNYILGKQIGREEDNKRKSKTFLTIGVVLNLGMLAFFKYFNFFIDSFIDLFSVFGFNFSYSTLKIILPVGISFYTFLSVSYLVDIYRNKSNFSPNLLETLISLSFFPIILAGPIHKPSALIQQIREDKKFDKNLAIDGLRQFLWGLFMKVAIADVLGVKVDMIFDNVSDHNGSTLLLGSILYTIQIYADFAGYSDMAIGIGKLLGFRLIRNFSYPYFSRDIVQFWKRWHISLTTWFRDYLFLPIAFSLGRRLKKDRYGFIKTDIIIYIIGITITWSLTGLWHGANYTFIVWGLLHGVLLVIYQIQRKPRKKLFKRLGISKKSWYIAFPETVITFLFVNFAWIIFRSSDLSEAMLMINSIFSSSLFTMPEVLPKMSLLAATFVALIIEFAHRNKEHALQFNRDRVHVVFRWACYYFLIIYIIYSNVGQQEFIYFQF